MRYLWDLFMNPPLFPSYLLSRVKVLPSYMACFQRIIYFISSQYFKNPRWKSGEESSVFSIHFLKNHILRLQTSVKQIAKLANISKRLLFLCSLPRITMMIQGCKDGKQKPRTDVSPTEDYGRHGNSTMSLFLIEPGLSLRIYLNTCSRQPLLINGHWHKGWIELRHEAATPGLKVKYEMGKVYSILITSQWSCQKKKKEKKS